LLQLFTKWGLPKAFRTDNGMPFGLPSRDSIPIMSLWLKGWGIHPILNRPKHPQDNAKVERAQGTSSRWAEIDKATDIIDLTRTF
jgi:transposase InsO family protein